MKSPILGDHHHHHCCTTWHDTMDWKVTIAQTLVRGTQQDFNLTTMAGGVRTFLNTVFFSNGTCSTGGAIPKVGTSLSRTLHTSIMTDNASQAADHFQ